MDRPDRGGQDGTREQLDFSAGAVGDDAEGCDPDPKRRRDRQEQAQPSAADLEQAARAPGYSRRSLTSAAISSASAAI